MGQIFNRIKNIANSYVNDQSNDFTYILQEDDDELKRIIDNLDSESKNHTNTNYKNFSSNKNHYELLGVSISSSKEEVYVAYKNLLKQYHPDKVANMGVEIQEIAQLKTKEINFAFQKIKEEKKW
jgi:DnaJ like chaperone protein